MSPTFYICSDRIKLIRRAVHKSLYQRWTIRASRCPDFSRIQDRITLFIRDSVRVIGL